MAWSTSDRKQELPADWAKIRLRIGARDRWSCQFIEAGSKCGDRANQCDHIEPGGPHEDWNLRMLCEYHHARKSSGEGGRARAAAIAAMKLKHQRPEEKNPVAPAPMTKPRYKGF